jgi:hypothetical protein
MTVARPEQRQGATRLLLYDGAKELEKNKHAENLGRDACEWQLIRNVLPS